MDAAAKRLSEDTLLAKVWVVTRPRFGLPAKNRRRLQAASAARHVHGQRHDRHVEVLKELLAKDAFVNAQGGNFGKAPYSRGRVEVVKLLLDKDADVKAQCGRCGNVALGRIYDSQEKSPLHLAARGGRVDTMVVLLDSGLDIKAADKQVTLVYAASSGSFEAVKFVLDASEAVSGDAADWNAIYLASKVGNIDVIRVLTEAGCQDRLVQTSEPEALWTLSSLAAFHGNASLIQDLCRVDAGKLNLSAAIQPDIDSTGGATTVAAICEGCEHVCTV